jgi:hypothetical protein
MLSQKEAEFLKSPNSFDSEYRKALRHRIRSKVDSLRKEILLLERAGYKVTENCNSVTEFNNPQISSNQAAFAKTQWTGGDLNPRPLECKSSVHTS